MTCKCEIIKVPRGMIVLHDPVTKFPIYVKIDKVTSVSCRFDYANGQYTPGIGSYIHFGDRYTEEVLESPAEILKLVDKYQ